MLQQQNLQNKPIIIFNKIIQRGIQRGMQGYSAFNYHINSKNKYIYNNDIKYSTGLWEYILIYCKDRSINNIIITKFINNFNL